MVLVIGLTGRIGAGKGTVAEYLKSKYKAQQFVYSDILADVLRRLHVEVTRENLQKLGKCLREGMGNKVLVDAMKGDLNSNNAKIRLIDGIRYVNEVDMLRSFPNNVLIFVDAPLDVRYERVKKRAQKGEGAMSLAEFKEKEKAATEKELDKVRKLADHLLDNTGSISDICSKIDSLMATA